MEKLGQKFSKHKLPIYKTLFLQFPLAFQEVVRASSAGHEKYLNHGDEDWQNFSRVPGGSDTYKDAALRHLLDSKNHTYDEDMKDYDPKVRHLAQFCWNALASLELEMREVKKNETFSWESPEAKKNEFVRIVESGSIVDPGHDMKLPDWVMNMTPEEQAGREEKLNAERGKTKVTFEKVSEDRPKKDSSDLDEWVVCHSPSTSDLRGVYVDSTEEQKEKLGEFRRSLATDVNKSYCDLKEKLDNYTEQIKVEYTNEDGYKHLKWVPNPMKTEPIEGNPLFNTDISGNVQINEKGGTYSWSLRQKPEETIPSYMVKKIVTDEYGQSKYFGRPTLSVDQLLNRDDYPDFPIDHEVG